MRHGQPHGHHFDTIALRRSRCCWELLYCVKVESGSVTISMPRLRVFFRPMAYRPRQGQRISQLNAFPRVQKRQASALGCRSRQPAGVRARLTTYSSPAQCGTAGRRRIFRRKRRIYMLRPRASASVAINPGPSHATCCRTAQERVMIDLLPVHGSWTDVRPFTRVLQNPSHRERKNRKKHEYDEANGIAALA